MMDTIQQELIIRRLGKPAEDTRASNASGAGAAPTRTPSNAARQTHLLQLVVRRREGAEGPQLPYGPREGSEGVAIDLKGLQLGEGLGVKR
jgi:hypothetical protein